MTDVNSSSVAKDAAKQELTGVGMTAGEAAAQI